MLDHLVFDTTDADSMLDSANVGAYVRSGINGKLITHHTIVADTYEALDVYAALAAGDGTPITQTGGALDVNIKTSDITLDTKVDGVYTGSNVDPDNVGLISHTRAVTPGDSDQIIRTTAGDLGTIALADLGKVHAIDVNSFLMAKSTSGDFSPLEMDNTDRGLLVHIANTVVSVNDAALANTTVISTAKSILSTVQSAVTAPLANRKYLWIYNFSNKQIFIGGAAATLANGFPISPGSYMELRAGAAAAVGFIGPATPVVGDLRTLEAA